MPKTLVIVESPTKAKTIAKFLPRDFIVESSVGHIRDLPNSAKEIPPEYKKEPWARLGIDIDNGFEPLYVVPSAKKKVVARLKSALKDVSLVYLATDEDREGESISWHLTEVLQPKVPRRRLVFHEITREAIEAALKSSREIDRGLVQAQETRRLLDRLYGYEVSPVLWKKIAPRLSAGRVQSVAVRMIVERERERMAFVSAQYCDLAATFQAPASGGSFSAELVALGKRRVATGKDFDSETGKLRTDVNRDIVVLDAEAAAKLADRLRSSKWSVAKVETRPYTSRPSPPFTTSTLQQEANRKLRLSTSATMKAAQRLYENGYITYMRTDSVTLSEEAIKSARGLIAERYGESFLPSEPRRYRTQVKNAQEAHEAIRPSAEFQRPEELRGDLSDVELKLYELVWKRTVACQMADARGQRMSVEVGDGEAVFQASGKTIEFPGFLRAYVEGADDPDAELADKETILPPLALGDPVACVSVEPKAHATQPPARFTEASLVKELEANGVGRPSTYASIIDVIQRREYVSKQGNALVPSFIAFAVVQLMERFFAELVDVQFTARMENDLDEISLGNIAHVPYLQRFYFGNERQAGLKKLIESDIDPRASCTIYLGKDSSDRVINTRVGRYGPYLERGEERASIPEGLAPDELTIERAEQILAKGSGPRQLGMDPKTNKPVYVKVGRYGPYTQLGDNDDEPKSKSLLPGMDPDNVTLEKALEILSLPRSLGPAPEAPQSALSGNEVLADYGRYGPYVRCGTETRSLGENDNVLTVTLERAIELLSQEKKASGWRARLQPKILRELGPRPDTQAAVKLLSGRYGPYVTDGETNASLPRGADPAKFTLEEAVEILRQRAAAGPSTRRATKRAPRGAKSPGARRSGAAAAKRSGERSRPSPKARPAKATKDAEIGAPPPRSPAGSATKRSRS